MLREALLRLLAADLRPLSFFERSCSLPSMAAWSERSSWNMVAMPWCLRAMTCGRVMVGGGGGGINWMARRGGSVVRWRVRDLVGMQLLEHGGGALVLRGYHH